MIGLLEGVEAAQPQLWLRLLSYSSCWQHLKGFALQVVLSRVSRAPPCDTLNRAFQARQKAMYKDFPSLWGQETSPASGEALTHKHLRVTE